jgi:hypothetical protein
MPDEAGFTNPNVTNNNTFQSALAAAPGGILLDRVYRSLGRSIQRICDI